MEALLLGLVSVLEPTTLLFLAAGVALGALCGIVPGLQNTTALSIILPFTYVMEPVHAFAMMTAIYAAGIYGGSITAILYRIPGAPENVATTFDGYPMARKGQAAKALGTAIFCSAAGGLLSVIVLIIAAPRVAPIALSFGPPEYFGLVFFALSMVAFIGSSMIKSVLSALLGLFLATVGIGPLGGGARFTFGSEYLLSGFDFIALMVGIFAIAEVLARAEQEARGVGTGLETKGRVRASLPTVREILELRWTMARGVGLGIFIGILPALGATVAAILGYQMERRVSKHPEQFGTGVLAGVAAPETANNASVGGAMIPFMTLGIPGSASTAIMLAAFQVYGLQPGMSLFREQAHLAYQIFASFMLANLLILVAGIVAVPAVSKLGRLPFGFLGPAIVLLCTIGAYSARNSLLDVWAMFAFGFLGYLMERHGFSISIFVLAFILGPLAESSFLRSMIMFDGNALMFFTKPLAGIAVALGVLSLVAPLVRSTVAFVRSRTSDVV